MLAGGGHSHALLLRLWLMRPGLRPQGTRITLVNRSGTALYSGMVPALVAGLFKPEECGIDLRRLCERAGVCFVQAEIRGLDPGRRELLLEGRPALGYDRLSLDVGAVTARPAGAPVGGAPVAVKPLEPFLAWCAALPPERPLRLRGGGAAAVELALALASRGHPVRLLLRGRELRLGSVAAARAAERMLAQAGVTLERDADPAAAADLACTGSRAPAWLTASGLPVDPASGRVYTDACLQVPGRPDVFACGDCAVIAADPRPPSGVWAVRAAPLLAANLQRSLAEPARPLRPWRPQRRALQLLADPAGDPAGVRALAVWGPLALGPWRWLWRWKERIDRRFMAGFADGAAMGRDRGDSGAGSGAGSGAMACRGCAAKLAPATLAAALERLQGAPLAPEDAAPLATAADGRLLLQSVDGFPALLQDPWLNGRITTLHACSDLWACGAAVESVQTLVTLPEAGPAIQEELLLHTLAGVRSVLDPLGARLIGGHSLEGRDGAGLALALVVNGRVPGDAGWAKGPLRPGDALLLSRPIGTGVLFAAAMAGAARPAWLERALAVMQASQAPLVALLAAHGCRACTDVTGFGLLGHLGEMVGASGAAPPVQVELDAAAVPALAGALELLARGHASTLAPANASALALLEGPAPALVWAGEGSPDPARQALLLDPQTCGPLLAALPAERADGALAAMRAAGFPQASLIGRVRAAPPLRPA